MLNKLVGIILVGVSVAFYGYWYSNPGYNPDSLFWIKMLVSGLSGFGIIIYESLPYMKNIKFSKNSQSLEVSTLESKDFEAVMYLKKRLKTLDSREGLIVLQKLNEILFKMDIDYADSNINTDSTT